MTDTLRIVIQVFDHATMQQPHGSARVVLSPAQLELIARTTDEKNIAKWAAEELGSIISCLEDLHAQH